MSNTFAHGTVHDASEDLQAAVRADSDVLALWENLPPLGRNEFICWVEDAKQPGPGDVALTEPARNCWRERDGLAAGQVASTEPIRRQADGSRQS